MLENSKLTSVEKLDLVLKFFLESPHAFPLVHEETLLKYLAPDTVGNAVELKQILDKLFKDEYVNFDLRNINGGNVAVKHYKLTFEGDYFFRYEGGYLGKYKKEKENNAQLDFYRKNQAEQAVRLNTLTTWISIGTVIAALYYIGEIFRIWILPLCLSKN
jgi:hypothetical protein